MHKFRIRLLPGCLGCLQASSWVADSTVGHLPSILLHNQHAGRTVSCLQRGRRSLQCSLGRAVAGVPTRGSNPVHPDRSPRLCSQSFGRESCGDLRAVNIRHRLRTGQCRRRHRGCFSSARGRPRGTSRPVTAVAVGPMTYLLPLDLICSPPWAQPCSPSLFSAAAGRNNHQPAPNKPGGDL